jgi:hypothetical protein
MTSDAAPAAAPDQGVQPAEPAKQDQAPKPVQIPTSPARDILRKADEAGVSRDLLYAATSPMTHHLTLERPIADSQQPIADSRTLDFCTIEPCRAGAGRSASCCGRCRPGVQSSVAFRRGPVAQW